MLGRVGQRALEGLVLLFALYAFALLPLGRRTAFEHVQAVLSTGEAREAGREIARAADRLHERLLPRDDEAIEGRGVPQVPELSPGPPVQARVEPADRPDASL